MCLSLTARFKKRMRLRKDIREFSAYIVKKGRPRMTRLEF